MQYQRDITVDLETGRVYAPYEQSYVASHIMVRYSPHWTNIGFFSFILLTVKLFCHPTRIEHGL